jgi:hypothetical protein
MQTFQEGIFRISEGGSVESAEWTDSAIDLLYRLETNLAVKSDGKLLASGYYFG